MPDRRRTTPALAVFALRKGLGYDWPGALRWGLPFLRQRPAADYCFEVVASMLRLSEPHTWHPLAMRAYALRLQATQAEHRKAAA